MAIVYYNGVAGKICADPDCGWKPLSEFGLARGHGDGYKSRCRECFNAQKRSERAANLEHYRETQRNYVNAHRKHYQELKRAHRHSNQEKYTDALHRYRQTHRAEINARGREHRQKNLEHYRAIGRKSRDKHADERNAYQRDYGKINRDKLTLFTNQRRARKLAASGSHTNAEWDALKAFYDFRCLCCGKQEPEIRLTRDHVIPLDKGGSDSIENVQPLCARCNSKKNNKHIDYRK
jgi:5-methylcytosine-specific restriction endonuclease McrA